MFFLLAASLSMNICYFWFIYIYICIYINTFEYYIHALFHYIYIHIRMCKSIYCVNHTWVFALGQDRNTWISEKALDLKGRTVAEKTASLIDLCNRGKVSGGLT